MEILIIIVIVILLLLALIGSVLPPFPGPLLAYCALLVYHFFINVLDFNLLFLIGLAVFLVMIVDYFLQIYGVPWFP